MISPKGVCLNCFVWCFLLGSVWMTLDKDALVDKGKNGPSKQVDVRDYHLLEYLDQDKDKGSLHEQNDPYTNYLFHPRLTFSGIFQSDIPSVNNDPSNYDTTHFVQTNYAEPSYSDQMFWNPRGSGEWYVDASVTQICYANGTCVADSNKAEPMLEAKFQAGGNATNAKMVDLDTEARWFAKIWGWRIRIGDFFSADFTPVSCQYLWKKGIDLPVTLFKFGTAYQSVLSNIRWIDDSTNSSLIQEWKRIMKDDNIESDKLSIRFNVDMYEQDIKKSTFTYGRVTGTIGLIGTKSPPFFSHGRMLHAQSQKVQNAPFIVDKKKKKVHIDFGNSLQITRNGSFDTGNLNDLYVGLSFGVDSSPNITCVNKFQWLGKVDQTAFNWYRNTAGVETFPLTGKLHMIANNPLVVAKVTGDWPAIECKEILLAEATDGVDIHPYDRWTMRKEPEETAKVRLIATKFGEPLSYATVHFETNNCSSVFEDEPPVAVPEIPPPQDVLTNSDGIAVFEVTTKDPKNPRDYIDGQLYPYTYSLINTSHRTRNFSLMCKQNMFELLNHLIVIVVYDKYGPVSDPTWLDNVYPIFKQYANLYPVMTENFIDLGNYYEVVDRKTTIILSMELPISHPNYMPVSRDLSPSKRKVILDWIKKDDPPTGKPKDFYTVDNLRKDLQTALQVELATIPPYLTALASLKYDYNNEVQNILFLISTQEMMHMNLVANILNAVGGHPKLYSESIASPYPLRLPGGVQPELVVPIEKLSINLIRNVFMKIEQPGVTQERKSSFNSAFDFVENLKQNRKSSILKPMDLSKVVDPHVDEDYFPCLVPGFKEDSVANFKLRQFGMSRKRAKRKSSRKAKPSKYDYEKHHNTIGDFYNHILNTLGYLTKCGQNNSIFTGDPSRQVDFSPWPVSGRTLKVTNFTTAVEAIKEIVEQGEGSSPCNPLAWSNGTVEDLSHYFLFYSIVEKREVQVFNQSQAKGKTECFQNTKVRYKECNGTYSFTGPQIPFQPDGVWPMLPNPKMSKFKKGTKAHLMADKFNKVYTKLLKSLEHVFNGYPESLMDALGLMFSVKLHMKELIRTPIDPDGDPDIGPNAGPTFDFVI